MAKVYLNYSPISTNGINSLDTAINNINRVISYLQQNSIPSDFKKYSTLSNTISDLKKQRDSLVNLKNWLKDSNKNYDSFISKLQTQAYKLPSGLIKRRSSIIK